MGLSHWEPYSPPAMEQMCNGRRQSTVTASNGVPRHSTARSVCNTGPAPRYTPTVSLTARQERTYRSVTVAEIGTTDEGDRDESSTSHFLI